MVRHTLKILQQMLQEYQSVSEHFGMLCIKGLSLVLYLQETKRSCKQQPNCLSLISL